MNKKIIQNDQIYTHTIIVKNSKFISSIKKVNTEKEATNFIKKIKENHQTARHNCYAYVVNEKMKCSDDKEPTKTAGLPILNILKKQRINNIVVVVTRYFGGTLLGTGGLVRAYSSSVTENLKNINIIEMKPGFTLKIITNYNEIGNILNIISQEKMLIKQSLYIENIMLITDIEEKNLGKFQNKIISQNTTIEILSQTEVMSLDNL